MTSQIHNQTLTRICQLVMEIDQLVNQIISKVVNQ